VSHIQTRRKWRHETTNLKINDIVIIKDDRLPSNKWKLGRIMQILIPGADQVVMVAALKPATGVIRGATCKLCVLPKRDVVESPCLPTGGGCLVIRPE
ncbi:hypothetical protein KR009_006546, partial [Drosophila setifemur]